MGVTRTVVIGGSVFAIVALFPVLSHAGDAGRANRDLAAAQDSAEQGRWDNLQSNMKRVDADMEGLSSAEKAPLLAKIADVKGIVTKSIEAEVTKRLDKAAKADSPASAKFDTDQAGMRLDSDEAKAYADPAVITKLRARLSGITGVKAPDATGTPETPKPAKPDANSGKPMSYELGAARARAKVAHAMMEQNDPRAAETCMRDTIRLLKDVAEADRGPVYEDMAALSGQIDAFDLKARLAEEHRRVDEQVHRYVGSAASSIREGVVCDPEWIDKSQTLLSSNDARTNLSDDERKTYQSKLDSLRMKLKEHNKEVALSRAEPIVKELEKEVAADPFKGVKEGSAYTVYDSLKTLSDRAHGELHHVPADDAEIKAMLGRITAANAKMESAVGKWAVEKTQEKFAGSWKFASQGFAGWEAETLSPTSAAQRRVEGLQKTEQAVRGTVYWLNSADTKEVAAKYKDNPAIAAVVASAQKTLDDSSAKLNEAFNAVVAFSEKQPMPRKESDRAEVGYLSHNAAEWFAGTKYKEADVARAAALDAKWKADVAKAEKEMAENLKKLTAEANAAWPKIELTVSADKGFDPTEAAQWKGKTIEIKGYYNRSGWDFDAAYDFAVGIKGVPVAGNYAPNVRDAFSEGSRHTQFGIDDHVGWDVIAVVEGPGQIKRRVTTEWKDKDTHELIMKTESYVPEPCVVLKIIGLRAGPVAVGPK